jgi:NAD-dependent deacetylase
MEIPSEIIQRLRSAGSIVAFTGAGVSAESGIPTFRDALTGFWAKFDPLELATPQAFRRDPEKVTRWYDERRGMAALCKPNPGHIALAELERLTLDRGGRFMLVTQNVDRLHQSAGSRHVVELHGALRVWRCTACGEEKEELGGPFGQYPPLCACGGIRRPAIVWFNEMLPEDALAVAEAAARSCDVFFTLGTSGTVYPAAGLIEQALHARAYVVEVNPERTSFSDLVDCSLRGRTGQVLPEIIAALQIG